MEELAQKQDLNPDQNRLTCLYKLVNTQIWVRSRSQCLCEWGTRDTLQLAY